MVDTASPQKVFRFRLAPWLPALYATYLYWLRHLLMRLGRDCTLSIWQEVQQRPDDDLLRQILGAGWRPDAADSGLDVEPAIARWVLQLFPTVIEGISPGQARQLVEGLPPIKQIRQTLSSLNVWRATTAYEALHLRLNGLACLTEALIRGQGKQGELIVYDMHREERIRAGGGKTGSVAEFITNFTAEPKEANIFTAGLQIETLRVSEQELVLHVKECAWAHYFRERHPEVGYLLACSTDEIAYRTFNENLRMQRAATLMEGGKVCDFRIYGLNEPFEALP